MAGFPQGLRLDGPPDPATCVAWIGESGPLRQATESAVAGAGYRLAALDDFSSAAPARFAFAAVGLETAGSDIAAARRRLDPDVYLIAVSDVALSDSWCERLLEIGCDDVASQQRRGSLRRACARAWRHLRRRSALADDRDYLQACIDNLPSPIFFKDRKGVYMGCNAAFERYIGLPRARVIGSTVYDVAPEHLARIYEAADEQLMLRRGTQIYDARVRYADGSEHDVSFQKAAFLGNGGEVRGVAGAMLDITERVALQEQLRRAAERDPLTGAYNRRKFFAEAETMEQRALAEGVSLSVFVLDVDNFKRLNDRWGHACGDAILTQLVQVLGAAMPENSLFARAGGEEFFGLFVDSAPTLVESVAGRLRETIAETAFAFDGVSLGVSASIGVAHIELPHEAIWQAIVRADKALYRAKQFGRDRVEIAASGVNSTETPHRPRDIPEA